MPEIRDFLLPDLGEGLEEAELVTWLVSVGDVVELNQDVAEVETAKATVAVPSPFAGVVVERCGAEGEQLDVGEVLLRIDVDADVAADATAAPGGGDGSGEAPVGEGSTPTGDAHTAPGATRAASRQNDGPAAAGRGLDAAEEPQPLVGYGARTTAPVRRGRAARPGGARGERGGGVLAKPAVRGLARQLGVDLVDVRPSGVDGVITAADVRAASVEGLTAPTPPRRAPDPAPGPQPGGVVAVRGVRHRIAEKMLVSRREIPHASATREADVSGLIEARGQLLAEATRQGREAAVTPFVLVMRAAARALRRTPAANARFTAGSESEDAEITYAERVNLGFAVATPAGLVVPNVKDADGLDVADLATQVARLTSAARAGSLAPADLTGGTFTVNNYGAFGLDEGEAIINHPEAGILGVGAIRQRPWVVDGAVEVRHTARFTFTFDHRVCDGAEAARFLDDVVTWCSHPSRLLLGG